MLYSIKKATGHETAKGKSTNQKKLWDNTPPPVPQPTP